MYSADINSATIVGAADGLVVYSLRKVWPNLFWYLLPIALSMLILCLGSALRVRRRERVGRGEAQAHGERLRPRSRARASNAERMEPRE